MGEDGAERRNGEGEQLALWSLLRPSKTEIVILEHFCVLFPYLPASLPVSVVFYVKVLGFNWIYI